MLSQLIYVSNRSENCTEKEIQKILVSCEKNNPPLNITGVLLYSDTKFIQLVEGRYDTILGLYDKLKTDGRHEQVRMISCGPIEEKAFPSWHMGSRKMVEGEVEFLTDINDVDKITFDNLLKGKEENGERVLKLLRKFF